jgi:hypothetical protein
MAGAVFVTGCVNYQLSVLTVMATQAIRIMA